MRIMCGLLDVGEDEHEQDLRASPMGASKHDLSKRRRSDRVVSGR